MTATQTTAAPADVPWLSAEQQRVWRSYLLGSARLAARLEAQLREFGLDLGEYEILVRLSDAADHRVRMAELADSVQQSRSRLTHTVGRMEAAGLVERVSCPTDRRGVWAHLTDDGMALLESAAPAHVRSVRQYFVDAMTEADYAALGRAFAAVAAACDE
jgi:DNA-binding MarR family transcriptional regulator